jgi:hypothetical protein
MTNWTTDQLATLGNQVEIDIGPTRADGTSGAARPIWIVVVDGNLYVRSYRGPNGAWYRQARRTNRAHITATGATYDVTLSPADIDPALIDAAYRDKYTRHGGSYVDAMVSPAAAATTLRLDPTPKEGQP